VLHSARIGPVSARACLPALMLSALLAACGGSTRHRSTDNAPAAQTTERATAPRAQTTVRATPPAEQPPAQALVTAETENRLLVVDLPGGRVVTRVALPSDPEDVAANSGACSTVVVVSAAGRKVSVLDRETMNRRGTLGGFAAAHIPEIVPGGQYAYVTDDARGTVTAISLATPRVTSTIEVGAGAHHLSFDTAHQRAWVALGESARTIVILSTADPSRPRVIGRFDPGFPAHDLSFSPDGARVWVTSATGPDVTVFSGSDKHVLFRVPVGPPPQHVALDGPYAYLSSGYGATIEKVNGATGRILRRAPSPYGSFELAARGGYVVTSSLLRGTLAIYTPRLKLLRAVHLARATREVALSPPA
jgi:DNA-binding beta-propeller fold protein YncE